MKWLIGVLLCLNLLIFILAYFGQDESQGYAPLVELPENVQPIDLLTSSESKGSGNCTNLGPIGQEIVLDRFVKILDQQKVIYKVISEPNRMIAAYRVVIVPAQASDISALKDQLLAVGIDEVYEKTAQSGEIYLSLGVFTYEKTAQDFAANLTGTGFAADYRSELLEYPMRYWLNLKKQLDQRVVNSLNNYIGTNTLRQTAAVCL